MSLIYVRMLACYGDCLRLVLLLHTPTPPGAAAAGAGPGAGPGPCKAAQLLLCHIQLRRLAAGHRQLRALLLQRHRQPAAVGEDLLPPPHRPLL